MLVCNRLDISAELKRRNLDPEQIISDPDPEHLEYNGTFSQSVPKP
jgi:hypothetical protein